MQLVFSDQPLPTFVEKSLFLEGPSPRDLETLDWRREAVEILEQLHYNGVVYIPCPKNVWDRSKDGKWDYDSQVSWEHKARFASDAIVCWVPRELEKMPALTTNVEFGEDFDLGRFYYGRPDWAKKCRYLDSKAIEQGLPIHTDLYDLLLNVVSNLKPLPRSDAWAAIPAMAWEFDSFRQWFSSMNLVGNELREATVTHVLGKANKSFLFVLQAKIYVANENRVKSNESVVFRKNTVTVVPYYIQEDGSIAYALVNEFRAATCSDLGLVKEFVSGSSPANEATVMDTVKEELKEELGLIVETSRLARLGEKQINATLLGHKTIVYALRLTQEEYLGIKKAETKKTVYGEFGSSEVITLCIHTKNEILKSRSTDCTTLAAVLMLEDHLTNQLNLKKSLQSLAQSVLLYGTPDREQTHKKILDIITSLNHII